MKPAQLGKRGVEMKDTHLLRDRQTVKLGLVKVVKDMFPDDSLKTTYSVQEGVFCRLSNSLMSKREVKQVGMKLNEKIRTGKFVEQPGFFVQVAEKQIQVPRQDGQAADQRGPEING